MKANKTKEQPQRYDNVEKLDYSKTDGYVEKIIDNETVLVAWYAGENYDKQGNSLGEKIREMEVVKVKDLALTRRPGFSSL